MTEFTDKIQNLFDENLVALRKLKEQLIPYEIDTSIRPIVRSLSEILSREEKLKAEFAREIEKKDEYIQNLERLLKSK